MKSSFVNHFSTDIFLNIDLHAQNMSWNTNIQIEAWNVHFCALNTLNTTMKHEYCKNTQNILKFRI